MWPVLISRLLTVTAAADIQEPRLSAGTEAFVGRVLGPVGEHGFRCDEAKRRDTFKAALALVDQLQGPEKEIKIWMIVKN